MLQGFLVATFLPADGYGVYTLTLSVIAVVFGIVDFRLADTVIRFVSEVREAQGAKGASWIAICFLAIDATKGLAAYGLTLLAATALASTLYRNIEGFSSLVGAFALQNLFLTLNPTLSAFLRIRNHFPMVGSLRRGVWIFLTDHDFHDTLGISNAHSARFRTCHDRARWSYSEVMHLLDLLSPRHR